MIISRYIAKSFLHATCLVIAVLAGIDSFIQLFKSIDNIGKGDFTILKALLCTLMRLPSDLYHYIPMAGFLGCLLGLGRLVATSELVVLRASGVSLIGITGAVIKATVLILIVATFIGEWIAPRLVNHSRRVETAAVGKRSYFSRSGEFWVKNNNDLIHVGAVTNDAKIASLTSFTVIDHKLKQASYAPMADVLPNNTWQMKNIRRTVFLSNRIETMKLPDATFKAVFNPVVFSRHNRRFDELTLNDIHDLISAGNAAGLNVEQYQYQYWQRIIQPVVSLILICLGVPFIFGSLREATMGYRIVVGVIVGFLFDMINQLLAPLSYIFQLSPIAAATAPAVLFILLYVILYRNVS